MTLLILEVLAVAGLAFMLRIFGGESFFVGWCGGAIAVTLLRVAEKVLG